MADPCERKQKSSSRVVHKQFGGTCLECKLFLQDPAAPDLQAEEVPWTAFLLAVSTHPHINCACTQMFACYRQQWMPGCSREDSSGLPWSRSSRETGKVWSFAGLISLRTFRTLACLNGIRFVYCMHTCQAPWGRSKALFTNRTMFMRVPYVQCYNNYCVDTQNKNQ